MILELDDHNKDKDKDKERKEEGTRRKKNLFNFSHTSPLLSIRHSISFEYLAVKNMFSVKLFPIAEKPNNSLFPTLNIPFSCGNYFFPSFFPSKIPSHKPSFIFQPGLTQTVFSSFFSPYSSHSHNLWNYVSVFILIARHWTSWNTV